MNVDTRIDLFALVIMLCCCFSVCTNTHLETDVYPTVSGPVFPPDKYDSLVMQAEQAAQDQAYLTGIVSEVFLKIKRKKPEPVNTAVVPYPIELDTIVHQ